MVPTLNQIANDIYIGMDIGGTNIKGALIASDGTILVHKNVPNKVGEQAVLHILAEINSLIEQAAAQGYPLLKGIGIAVPGKIDATSTTIIAAPNLQWENVDLVARISEQFDLPVKLCNDTNAAVLGEYVYGGHREDNLICLTIGTGIGSGIILNGRLHTGTDNLAGEIGHMVMVPNGPDCPCGNKGCLEAITAAPAMVKRYVSRLEQQHQEHVQQIEMSDIVSYARAGDETALAVLQETADVMGLALANVSNVLDVRTFVLSGGVMKAEWPLREKIAEAANANSLSPVQVITSTLINSGANLGAITMFLDDVQA